MKHLKENDFSERRKSAAEAKKQLLERLKNVPKPDEAARAEKVRLAAEREARRAERLRLKQEELEREKAEAAAAAAAEEARLKAEAEAQKQRELEEAAERKAERDRRYAARKNRSRFPAW